MYGIKGCCNICFEESVELVAPYVPKKGQCNHLACRDCWKGIAKDKPLCPFCRLDLKYWLKNKLKVNVGCKYRKDNIIDETPDILEELQNYIRLTMLTTGFVELPNNRNRRTSNTSNESIRNHGYLDENGKFYCDCGSIIKQSSINRHTDTMRHQNWISQNLPIP